MIKKMLVPIDDTPASEAALETAVELAGCTNATITLMTVVEVAATWVAGPFGAVAELVEEDTRAEHRAHQRLLRIAAEMIPDGIAFNTITVDGDPAKQIVQQLERDDYDLVVLGSRGLGALKSMLLGGVSRKVLERTNTPALLVRATKADLAPSETVTKLAAAATHSL